MDFVDAEDGFVLSEFFGGQAYYSAVVCIGYDLDQANGQLCLDLNKDIGWLAVMSNVELRLRLAEKRSPIRHLRINTALILTALFDALTHMLSSSSIDDIKSRTYRVKNDTALRDRLILNYVVSCEPFPLSPHIEERIYNGFLGPNNETRMAASHKASWPDRFAIM